MTDDERPKLVQPPSSLKDKVGNTESGDTVEAMLARADKAVEVLSNEFVGWIEDDIKRLQDAHDALTSDPDDPRGVMDRVYNVAHDMRGQGGSYGFPLITRVGSSLCRYIEGRDWASTTGDLQVVSAHIGALNVVLARKVRGEGDEVSRKVADELEALVAQRLA